MAQVTPISAQSSPLPPQKLEEEAVRSVTLYFRSVGLPQENALKTAEEVVQSCQAKWVGRDPNLTARAMDRAMNRLGDWFDRLATANGSPSPGARAQLGWYLRPLIRAHPEVFLLTHDLPDDFSKAVEAACKPLLPLMSPRMMPPQSLWQLPHLWQRGIAYAYLMWYRFKSMRWLGRT
jgi:hypothetical protein